MTALDWSGSAFVATPGDVPITLVPEYVTRLFFQVASGVGSPGAPLDWPKVRELRQRGKQCEAWAWCVGPTQPGGGEPEDEARAHAKAAGEFGATTFVANMESFYDAGGNQGDIRYQYVTRYFNALEWDGPLGITTTPTFASDMTAARARGAIYMPQAFLENGKSIVDCVEHGKAWGWATESMRPLIQTYDTDGALGDWQTYKLDADFFGVGVVPFVIERAMVGWLDRLQKQIVRPTKPGGTGGGMATLIGSQDGIEAAMNRLRNLDPTGTKLVKVEGKWQALSALPADLGKWGAYDKLQRTLQILADDHDEGAT